ncbi:MAG TPA: hypothetical protein VGP22_17650, partial [Albitalea sp.]|nr:hypothetical protein [Albitalea sp.]
DRWFRHNPQADVLGVPVRIANMEDSFLSKAFIMERERYDGADIAHLLRAQAHRIDWQRLLRRFGPHWRVLLGHLVLFGFVYPGDRSLIPPPVMDELLTRLRDESAQLPPRTQLCAGTLLSREQYLNDVEQQGLQDARVTPLSTMTPQDVADWTGAIASRQAPPEGGSR